MHGSLGVFCVLKSKARSSGILVSWPLIAQAIRLSRGHQIAKRSRSLRGQDREWTAFPIIVTWIARFIIRNAVEKWIWFLLLRRFPAVKLSPTETIRPCRMRVSANYGHSHTGANNRRKNICDSYIDCSVKIMCGGLSAVSVWIFAWVLIMLSSGLANHARWYAWMRKALFKHKHDILC